MAEPPDTSLLCHAILGRGISVTETLCALLRYKNKGTKTAPDYVLQQAWSLDSGNGIGQLEWRDVPIEEEEA